MTNWLAGQPGLSPDSSTFTCLEQVKTLIFVFKVCLLLFYFKIWDTFLNVNNTFQSTSQSKWIRPSWQMDATYVLLIRTQSRFIAKRAGQAQKTGKKLPCVPGGASQAPCCRSVVSFWLGLLGLKIQIYNVHKHKIVKPSLTYLFWIPKILYKYNTISCQLIYRGRWPNVSTDGAGGRGPQGAPFTGVSGLTALGSAGSLAAALKCLYPRLNR